MPCDPQYSVRLPRTLIDRIHAHLKQPRGRQQAFVTALLDRVLEAVEQAGNPFITAVLERRVTFRTFARRRRPVGLVPRTEKDRKDG